MAPSAHIVVDLGFGDSGKGKVVDYLTRRLKAKLVVRFNGGAQAAHNVVTPEGLHHTFSQWGSGTLVAPDVLTLLGPDVAIHPTAMQAEAEILQDIGQREPLPRLMVDRRCLVTTPFHQALNRMRELRRAEERHGSCGVGFGETVRMDREEGLRVRVLDVVGDRVALVAKLREIRQSALKEALGWPELPTLARHRFARRWYSLLFDRGSVDLAADLFRRVFSMVRVAETEEVLRKHEGHVIFEGAQGVLLDEVFGFAPHNTWSTTTGGNAARYRHLFERVSIVGVTRAYPTRHGAGPFPTEDAQLSQVLADPRNQANPWQGAIRTGWFDPELLRYALLACEATQAPIERLAVTHLDAIPRAGIWKSGLHTATTEADVVAAIAGVAGRPVWLRSWGPTSADTTTTTTSKRHQRSVWPGRVRASEELF